MTDARTPARDKLLAAASRLFYDRGIGATGIDAIIAEAGVAKMSLYNNFTSKDELVLAYIEARHEEWLHLYAARLADCFTPVDRILAVFDAYIDHAELAYDHGFRGCGLLNAAAELPVGAPGREAVARHKAGVESILRDQLLEITSVDQAGCLAEHISFLLEGSMSRAGLEGQPARLQRARNLAESMVRAL
ncbi:MAG: TetR/AcrR family transcriptional regulator [Thermomicrobiales bacterium]|nr:TetR/AcrR family transcriptional regulator [Thermomicrobiales bacterium]